MIRDTTVAVEEEFEVFRAAEAAMATIEQAKEMAVKAAILEVHTYDFERAVEEMRTEILKAAVRAYAEKHLPNVEVDPSKIIEELGDEPTASQALEKVKELRGRAAELSLGKLLENARRLLPHVRVGEWRRELPSRDEHIRRGRVLVLRAHTWDSNWKSISGYAWDYFRSLNALDKLARVVLHGRSPITVESSLELSRDESIYQKRAAGIFDAIRFYKNDKLEVWLGTEEEAKKLAAALLQGPAEGA